jgi:hypothetical protein
MPPSDRRIAVALAAVAFYRHPVAEGIAGLLVSPGKGLFVFSCFFAFLVRRLRRGVADPPNGRLDALLAAAVVLQIVFYARADWRAGACYGTRFLSGALPALVFLLAPAVRTMSGGGRLLLSAAVVLSIAIEAVGAFCYPRGGSDDLYYPAGQSRLPVARAVWLPQNAAFWIEARGGIAPPDLFSRSVRDRR